MHFTASAKLMVLPEVPEAEPTWGAVSPVSFPSLLQQTPAELEV